MKIALDSKLSVNLFVDDRHENSRDVAENTKAIVLMPHRSYNRSFEHSRVTRIQDLQALAAYLADRSHQRSKSMGRIENVERAAANLIKPPQRLELFQRLQRIASEETE